ncbi:MAG: hypothetical protein H6Q67_980 [Firmicutes bacterium]|nr:hypothetical protein [Bacillota bacterium]
MNNDVLMMLQDPYTKDELQFSNGVLMNKISGRTFLYENGYYSFLEEGDLEGNNREYYGLYDIIAWCYNISTKIYFFFKFGNEYKVRSEYFKEISIKDGDKVLEISIGTGDNLPYLNGNSRFFGIDISKGMLKMAKKHLKKGKIPAYLFRCDAEKLPFKDNTFDVVYHVGGLNFFKDKQKAINEMIRVAKPGTKIMIAETKELVKNIHQRNPFFREYYQNTDVAYAPVNFVPQEMEDINIVNQGLFCYMTFRKPI